jgi:phosphoserine phosphatase RsbU/P
MGFINEGLPIPAEVLPTIFGPFRRGNVLKRSESLGLGLFIAREIVRAHGGKIDVSSADPEGTTFTVLLPRAAPGSFRDLPSSDDYT